MSEVKLRMPFHEALALALNRADSKETLRTLFWFANYAIIPAGHNAILEMIDSKGYRGLVSREVLESVKNAVLDQKAEAEKATADMAKQTNDKTSALMVVIERMMHVALENIIGDSNRNNVAKLFEVAKRIKDAKTSEELEQALKWLE